MNVELFKERVLVKEKEVQEVTKGGIIISKKNDMDVKYAAVVKKSSDCELDLQEGDTVMIPTNAGYMVRIDNENYIVVSQDDILARERGGSDVHSI